jgi:hypothetical protein
MNDKQRQATEETNTQIKKLRETIAECKQRLTDIEQDPGYAWYLVEYYERVQPHNQHLYSTWDGRDLGFYGPPMTLNELREENAWGVQISEMWKGVDYIENRARWDELIELCSIHERRVLA